MSRHFHYCACCGDSIYTCHESGSYDEGCANAAPYEKEYCRDCCVPDIDEDDDTVTNVEEWHARLAAGVAKLNQNMQEGR